MVVDTQFHKFYGKPFARSASIFIPHERYRSVTPLGLRNNRVFRTAYPRSLDIFFALLILRLYCTYQVLLLAKTCDTYMWANLNGYSYVSYTTSRKRVHTRYYKMKKRQL